MTREYYRFILRVNDEQNIPVVDFNINLLCVLRVFLN